MGYGLCEWNHTEGKILIRTDLSRIKGDPIYILLHEGQEGVLIRDPWMYRIQAGIHSLPKKILMDSNLFIVAKDPKTVLWGLRYALSSEKNLIMRGEMTLQIKDGLKLIKNLEQESLSQLTEEIFLERIRNMVTEYILWCIQREADAETLSIRQWQSILSDQIISKTVWEGIQVLSVFVEQVSVDQVNVPIQAQEIEGTEIREPVEDTTKRCPQCGAEVASDDLFCSNCGQKLPVEGDTK